MRPLIPLIVAFACSVRVGSAQPTSHVSVGELRAIRLPDVQIDSAEAITPDRQKNPNAKSMVQWTGVIGGASPLGIVLPGQNDERFLIGGGWGFGGITQKR